MPNINGLTNPFENSILNMNLTQLEKDKQLADYSAAISQGYEPPADVLDEMAALLASGNLSTEAQARLQALIDLIMVEFGPVINGGDTAQVTVDENTSLVATVTALDQYSLNDGVEALHQVIVAEVSEMSPPTNFGAVLNGVDAGDRSGFSVSSAGDANGDGFDDMLIGAYKADPNGGGSGETYLVYGVASGISTNLDLSTLDGSNGFVMNGIDAGDRSGFSVSSAGDVNGDGFDDMLIGAYKADPNGGGSGETYLVYGAASGIPASLDLSSLDGSNGFMMNGIDTGDRSGVSVSSAGDVNNDGFDDMLIGANRADPNGNRSGETYLVYGAASGIPVSLDLSSLDGSNGFVMKGIDTGDRSGISVSSAGDVNGDGFDDTLIGANRADPNGNRSGETYLIYGAEKDPLTSSLDLSTLNGSNGFVMNGIDNDDNSGFSVSSAGDVNSDGFDDMLIGAKNGDPNGSDSGETYLVYGGQTILDAFDLADGVQDGTIELSGVTEEISPPPTTFGAVLNGIDAGDESGRSVSSAGDVNGDGYDDMLIGAWRADPNGSLSGETYLVYGAASGIPASLDLSSLDGSNGFVMNGIHGGDFSGHSVSSAGDVNGDGYDDMLIGAVLADPNGTDSGETYLVFGAALGIPASLDLSSLDGSNGFVMNGIDPGDQSGGTVSSAGDVNGDGFDDMLIGAHLADPNGRDSGETYLVYGAASGIPASFDLSSLDGSNGFVMNGIDAGDYSSSYVSSAGDVNGDGYDDMLIGAWRADPNGHDSGETYLVYGAASGIPASLDLSSLDGSNGFVMNGIDAGDQSGQSVSSAGDVNGDGYDDMLIGAMFADPNGNRSGEIYLVYGAASGIPASLDLSTLDGSNGFIMNGIDNDDQSGTSVSSAGDVNGDGYDDMLIGARRADSNGRDSGETYLVYGAASGIPASLDLSTLDGTNGFVMNGIDAEDLSGVRVSSAGDVNSDGFDDMLIGAQLADPNGSGSGESYLVYGGQTILDAFDLADGVQDGSIELSGVTDAFV